MVEAVRDHVLDVRDPSASSGDTAEAFEIGEQPVGSNGILGVCVATGLQCVQLREQAGSRRKGHELRMKEIGVHAGSDAEPAIIGYTIELSSQ
jgi:hypothetical protein